MTELFAETSHSPLPRKLGAFHDVLGDAPGHVSRTVMDQVRIMAATSNDGVVLMLGPSSLWQVPWVMDSLQPGTRAVAVVPPSHADFVKALGPLLHDDLRLAVRVQDPNGFLQDMGDQKFDLIIDLDSCADLALAQAQIFGFGSLVLGCVEPVITDPKEVVSIHFVDEQGDFAGQLIKPRPAPLRRRGGRKTRLEGRKAGPKPPKELFEGAFPEGGPMASA